VVGVGTVGKTTVILLWDQLYPQHKTITRVLPTVRTMSDWYRDRALYR
jgi:hypothetical protein